MVSSMLRVSIIGDSFPARLCNDLREKRQCLNLNIDPAFVQLAWVGRGGLTISRLLYNCSKGVMSIPPSDCFIVNIGSNDLVQLSSAEFLYQMHEQLLPFLFSHGVRLVVFNQIMHRRQGRYTTSLDIDEYNNKVDFANSALKSSAENSRQLAYWKQSDLTKSGSNAKIWSDDGVHLKAKEGHPHYVRSLRGAVLFHGARVFDIR